MNSFRSWQRWSPYITSLFWFQVSFVQAWSSTFIHPGRNPLINTSTRLTRCTIPGNKNDAFKPLQVHFVHLCVCRCAAVKSIWSSSSQKTGRACSLQRQKAESRWKSRVTPNMGFVYFPLGWTEGVTNTFWKQVHHKFESLADFKLD